jgi:Uma2 family endonuclease
VRSPDVSWVRNDRLSRLSDEEWEKFLPLCPDFVLELRSPSDSLQAVRKKLEEYIDNGARLGWLLDAGRKAVEIYRADGSRERIEDPSKLSGDPVLAGFVLDVRRVWSAMKKAGPS